MPQIAVVMTTVVELKICADKQYITCRKVTSNRKEAMVMNWVSYVHSLETGWKLRADELVIKHWRDTSAILFSVQFRNCILGFYSAIVLCVC